MRDLWNDFKGMKAIDAKRLYVRTVSHYDPEWKSIFVRYRKKNKKHEDNLLLILLCFFFEEIDVMDEEKAPQINKVLRTFVSVRKN